MNPLLINNISIVNTEDQDDFVDKLISGWEFYLPEFNLAVKILRLNDRIGDEYFGEKYWDLQNTDEHLDLEAAENNETVTEKLNNPIWQKDIFNRIKSILFHDETFPNHSDNEEFLYKFHEEDITLFRRYISERIYNHLAMLARSPHAREGGAFSIREDIILEIPSKIGLGLYFSDQISGDTRAEIDSVLKELAEDFEKWFIDTKVGYFSATFAEVVSFERKEENCQGNKLILLNDVRNRGSLTA